MNDGLDSNPYAPPNAPLEEDAAPSETLEEAALPASTVVRLARTALAAVLSLVLPGLGQLYNRDWLKAALFCIGAFVLWFVLLGWVFHFWGIADAAVERWYRAGAEEVGRGRKIGMKVLLFLVVAVSLAPSLFSHLPL